VSIGLLHQNEDLDSRQLIDRVESDGEPTTLYDRERSSVVRIGRVGMLSETLSGGAVAMYLLEIAQHELVAASEEVSLAQRIEASKAAIRALAAVDPNMDDGQRVELERLVQDGAQARRRLIECNLRLVVSVARRYVGRNVSFWTWCRKAIWASRSVWTNTIGVAASASVPMSTGGFGRRLRAPS
jgi:DNA-directed RNA polymerase sigma subunit (sigma70/sigma32)